MKKIPKEERRANHNDYQREYRKRNPAKVAEWQMKCWQRKLEKLNKAN